MRPLGWLAILLAAMPMASAVDPYVVLLDWQEGHSIVGTSPLVASPVAPTFPVLVDGCHRRLLVDLLYDPAEGGAHVEGVGDVALAYDFLVDALQDGNLVARARVTRSGYGFPMGAPVAQGGYDVRVSLADGADVSWALRVRGQSDPLDPACFPPVFVNEVEANPPGTDAGFEWVELYNADNDVVDVSGWTITATHNVPASLTLPSGTSIAAGGFLKVAFSSGQFLDNVDEVVELRDDAGRLRDATPAASDSVNDSRSWQRSPDGSDAWSFALATPGATNG